MDVPGAGLLEVFWKTREVSYVEANPKLICQSENRFQHVFTKLQCFGCDDYEKVVLLDIDLLVRDNIDELSSCQPPCALRRGHKALPSHVDVSLSCYNTEGRQKFGMNLGVAVLKPSKEELEKILTSVKSRDPMHEVCSGPEQDFLSRWFKNWTSMNVKYNYQLHQLALSCEHEGPQAMRLQLKLENVKVLHYSGRVKPWDFYFDVRAKSSESFSAFCEERLLPAYNAKGKEFEDTVRNAAHEWKQQCKDMWQYALAQTSCDKCKLCTIPKPLDLEACRQYKLSIKYLEDVPFFNQKGIHRRGLDGAWDVLGLPADWSQEDVADLYAEFIRSCHQERAARRDFASFLVFLPGKRELQLLWERLDDVTDLQVKCIFGGQTIEEQERVLSESHQRERSVILGTDVIESSVTIPDVDLVIDTCEQKRLRWDGGKNQSLLTLVLVSKDEAKQRSGRTGRVRDGEVIRLVSKGCFDRLQPHAEPQIKHSRLEDLLLSLFELPNLGDPRQRANVLALMKLLDQQDVKPPMQSLDQKHGATLPRMRGPLFDDVEFSSLVELRANNLDNFRL
eukprot:g2378.t1